MNDDHRKAKLESEYRRYFPTAAEPKAPLTQRAINRILAGIPVVIVVLVLLELLLGAAISYLL